MRGNPRALGRIIGLCLTLTPFVTNRTVAAPPPETGSDRATAIRTSLETWDLTGAEAALKTYNGDDAVVLRARADLMRGRFEDARKRLAPTVDRLDYEARVLLGIALQSLGRREEAFQVLDAMADDYNDDRVTTARDLMWLGMGLMMTDYPKNAHRVFKESVSLEPSDDAKLAWAELYLSKYDYRAANPLFKEVLAKTPTNLRAAVGLARVAIESDRAFSEASDLLVARVEKHPECVPCQNVLALVDLHNERAEAARTRLESTSLKTAPTDPEALALLGATYYLMDDVVGYRAAEKRALAVNPRAASFYTTVADHAEREHRYVEAIELLEKALSLDPDNSAALSMLGTGYSRTGADDKAKTTLALAFEADPFNVRTYNLLTHFYDKVDKLFTWVDASPMRVRVDKREAPVLGAVVPPLLIEAEKALSKKYGFSPRLPMHIEIFADTQTFAVRSTGLPGLAAHGICFGHVITARSPSAGNFNWAEVLWHELAHVYHIQLSRGRVPRWFTEGMAVYESTEGRPSWEREQDRELLSALRAKKLRGVEDFNLAFTQARTIGDILVAYYHAFYVARFIHVEWDFARARRMVALWGDKKKTPEVFATALDVTPAEFDTRFFKWLEDELGYLERAYPWELSADHITRADAMLAAPDGLSAPDKAAAAMLLFSRGDHAGAEKLATAALESGDLPLARHVRGMANLAKARGTKDDGALAAAKADFEHLRKASRAGVEDLSALAHIAEREGDLRRASSFLSEAVALDPKDERTHRNLVAMFDKLELDEEAYRARIALMRVDQMDAGLVIKTLALATKLGKTDAKELARIAEQAVHIAPFSLDAHLAAARAFVSVDKKAARRWAELALLVDPNSADAKALAAP